MKNSATQAAQILADVINHDLKIRGIGRGLLDSIDAFQNSPDFTTKSGYGKWLNRGAIRKKGNRDLINTFNQSPSARKIINQAGNLDIDESHDLICEHVIPCTILLGMLHDRKKSKKILTAEDVITIHNQYYRRCILTKDEDKILTKNKLSKKMPKFWDNEDVYARYREVGFDWVDNLT